MFQDVSFAKVGTGTPVDIVVQVTRTDRDHVSLQALWHGENCRALHADFQAGEIRTPYGYVVHHSQGTAHLLLPGPVAQAVRVQRKRQAKFEPESFVQDTQAAGTTDSALWKGLLSVQQNFPNCPTVLLPPISAEDLPAVVGSLTKLSAFAEVPAGTLLLLAFLHDGHWGLLSFRRAATQAFEVTYLDGIPGRLLHVASILAHQFCEKIGLPLAQFKHATLLTQAADGGCGECLLAHAHMLLSGDAMHAKMWASQFLAQMPDLPGRYVGWGGLSEDQKASLRRLLVEHGVPEDQVQARIEAALTKLGAAPLAGALQAKNPWQSLKSAASRPGAMFKWVSTEELQRHIEQKAHQKFGTDIPRAKRKKQKTASKRPFQAPLNIDPANLQLTSGSFESADGEPLAQLSFAEVGSQATGVCFCTPSQAAPFLADPKPLSVGALGLLITAEVPQAAQGLARIASLRFPAIYAPTQEAVLVAGSLLQLGDSDVQVVQGDVSEIESLETAVCKITVYKDEWKHDWAQLLTSPVRCVLQHSPELALCRDPQCPQTHCNAFHAAVDETVEQLLIDVWGRQFTKLAGGKVPPEQAEVFQAYVRVPASALTHLVQVQRSGLYVEPRASDGTGPHPAWAVVWLPGSNLAHAVHLLRTTAKAISLTRLNQRYGLRTKEADEQSVFELLRPDQEFVKIRVHVRFRLHPLPFGYQRHSVLKLLKKWGWAVKPLQPDRGDSTGAAWIVGAASDPPQFALPLADSFVLISKSREAAASKTPPSVFASNKTKRHILYDDGPTEDPNVDPWLAGGDPWALARPAAATPPRTEQALPSAARTKWNALEHGIKDDVQALIRQERTTWEAGHKSNEDRFQKLEAGMAELQHQNQKFEGWFQTFGAQVGEQATSLQHLSASVKQQQTELQQVKGDVERSVTAAVTNLTAEVTNQMAAQLQGQMQQIQELFADKKARTN